MTRDGMRALQAYRKWVAKYGIEDSLPGLKLNHDQLFFLNFAQVCKQLAHGYQAIMHT